MEGQTLPIDHLNKLRQPYGVYMLNADFSSTSRNTTDGIDVILRIKEGSFAVGGTVRAVVAVSYTHLDVYKRQAQGDRPRDLRLRH